MRFELNTHEVTKAVVTYLMKIKVSPLHWMILSWHRASPYQNLSENKPKEMITEKEETNGHFSHEAEEF